MAKGRWRRGGGGFVADIRCKRGTEKVIGSSRSEGECIGEERFDVFASYSHAHASWVERLAHRLREEGFSVWLDRWRLVPGKPWQQEMARGLDQAGCCAVCIGKGTPTGWFSQEIQRALNRQAKDPEFRVIPVLLPGADTINVDDFLELRTWVDFRTGTDLDYAFHLLLCGIKNIPPGPWWPPEQPSQSGQGLDIQDKLRKLRRLTDEGLIHNCVCLEYQRKILDAWIRGE